MTLPQFILALGFGVAVAMAGATLVAHQYGFTAFFVLAGAYMFRLLITAKRR